MKILSFWKNSNFPNGNLEEQSDEDEFDKDVDMKKIIEPKNNKNLLKKSKSDNFKQLNAILMLKFPPTTFKQIFNSPAAAKCSNLSENFKFRRKS
jgi:hypothetical protein